MTKKQLIIIKRLEQANIKKHKLQHLETKYDELVSKSKIKVQQITGMPFVSGFKKDGVSEYNVELIQLENEITKARAEMTTAYYNNKRFISKIPDETIQIILTHMYNHDKDDIEVASIMKMNVKTIRKILNVFFNEIIFDID